jgi:hypothetical protein
LRQRPFDEVWQELKQLEGKTVYTLCRRWRNDILRFDSNRMWRVAHRGSKQPKPVPKRTFRKVWERLLIDGEFMPKDVLAWKIACACIAHLPEVEYSCKEGFVHLYLRLQSTHPFGEVREYTEGV